MKRLINKLRERRGETLLESLASIAILSILLISVTMMIRISLNMTSNAMRKAGAWQELANKIAAEDYGASPKETELILNVGGKEIRVPVYYTDEDYNAFFPKP